MLQGALPGVIVRIFPAVTAFSPMVSGLLIFLLGVLVIAALVFAGFAAALRPRATERG
jgi:hypothetical protein